MHDCAEICGRSKVSLRDAETTLKRAGFDLNDLNDFAADFKGVTIGGNGSSVSEATQPLVPEFPAPAPLRLNHLKPGSQEVLHRK